MGLNFSKPCIIALDEIQLANKLPSFIKFVYDNYSVKFIVTGSSSYYMKNLFSESLSGRKAIFEMLPLAFNEFIVFKNISIRQPEKYSMQTFNAAWFKRMKEIYLEYLKFGGFPEVVIQKKEKDKIELLWDIINSYIELDIKLLSDYSASQDLFNLIKLLSARVGSKVDFTKLSSVCGINRQKISEYISLFDYTYFIYLVKPFTFNADKEIVQQPKIYFADNGILNVLGGKQLSSGQLFENAICTQLKHKYKLNYHQKKSGQEIDFILDEKIAVEVKETPIQQDFNSLRLRAETIKIKQCKLIGKQQNATDFDDFLWGGSIY
jgi:predicted AAA+ superfamily ATPase